MISNAESGPVAAATRTRPGASSDRYLVASIAVLGGIALVVLEKNRAL